MQVLPFRCHRALSRRLTVRSNAFAFGYSLAAKTVYQIPQLFERSKTDS